MSAATSDTISGPLDLRILNEGYGAGAWHGPDLKAALADVTAETAFWRPAPGRHNIAEIALHHAFYARSVRARLSGIDAEPFVLEGDDWFAVPDASRMSWSAILELLAREQVQLTATVARIADGGLQSPRSDTERFDLILGITCHAIYHAGQVQLIKKLRE